MEKIKRYYRIINALTYSGIDRKIGTPKSVIKFNLNELKLIYLDEYNIFVEPNKIKKGGNDKKNIHVFTNI
jgi:hypothetical protein